MDATIHEASHDSSKGTSGNVDPMTTAGKNNSTSGVDVCGPKMSSYAYNVLRITYNTSQVRISTLGKFFTYYTAPKGYNT